MKKLFNYALLAAALLIGVNVNAAASFVVKNASGTKVGDTQTTLPAAVALLEADATNWTITVSAAYTIPAGTYDLKGATLKSSKAGTVRNLTLSASKTYTFTNGTLEDCKFLSAGSSTTKITTLTLDKFTGTTLESSKSTTGYTKLSMENGSVLSILSGVFPIEDIDLIDGLKADGKYLFRKASTCVVGTEDQATAKIGEELFLTVADAFAIAEEDDEITLLAAATTNITLTKNIVIDLNGFNILGTNNTSIFTLSTADKSLKLINGGDPATITTQRSNDKTYYVATLTAANTSIEVVGDITMDASATTGSNSCINMGIASAKAIIDGATVGIYANKGSDILVKEGSHATIVAGSLIDCKLANGTNIASTVLIGGGFYGFIPEITLPAGLTYAESWCEELGDCYEVQENKIASINGGETMTLADAFTEAQDGDVIKIIGAGVEVAQGSTAYLNEAKEITLDLNGKTLVFNHPEANGYINARMIAIGKGILHIKNGTMLNNTEVNSEYKTTKGGTAGIILMTGELERNSNAMENYSTQLFVEEGVVLDCQYGKSAVEIYDYVGLAETHTHTAYGVYANIAGKVHGEKYGMQISGQVNVVPAEGEDAREYNYPWFVIEKTGEVKSNPTTTVKGGVGIYMGGFGILDIYGYVHGATGVYVKNGDVKIEDAIIVSDYTGDFAPAQNGGSSVEGGGSALVIVTNKNTYGDINVTISGDTKISGGSGYGIEEEVNKKEGEEQYSDLASLKIEGGTIESGDKGGVVITDDTNEHNVLVITGGTSEGTVQVGKPGEGTSSEDVNNYVPKDGENKGHVTEIKDEEGNVIAVVVTKGDEPEKVTLEKSDDIMKYEGKSINFDGSTVEQELTGDLNLKELSMVDATEDEKLVVPDDVTLHVEKLIMGANASITVAQGGTLIVDGEQGIVAQVDGNIVIEAQEGQMGQFLFNPEVTSNRHPVATVTLHSKAFTNSKEEQEMDFIGIPMQKVTNIAISDDKYAAVFDVWRRTEWDRIGGINFAPALDYNKFDVPFGLYRIFSSNHNDVQLSYDITGELLGNTEPASIRVLNGWTSAANSWTGDINFAAIINALKNTGNANLTKSIYLGRVNGSYITWDAYNPAEPIDKVEPMQAMMFYNDGAAFDARIMTYKDLVWDPVVTPAKAPRMEVQMGDKVVVKVTSEQGITDRVVVGDFDEDCNAPKFMENPVCVYAHGEKNYDIMATSTLDNTFIGFNGKDGAYTLSFGEIRGNYALVDLMNNARIEMTDGATYEFTATGDNDHRFMIVEGAKAPTNNEKVAAKVNAVKVISGSEFRIVKDGRAFNAIGAEL